MMNNGCIDFQISLIDINKIAISKEPMKSYEKDLVLYLNKQFHKMKDE
jgi:hypothetical protein